jgi:hypothetical protein
LSRSQEATTALLHVATIANRLPSTGTRWLGFRKLCPLERMTRTVPVPIATRELPGHPVLLAWLSVSGSPPDRVEQILRRGTRSKPALYRLDFTRDGRPSVFAKHGPASRIEPERKVYESILPHVPVTSPRFFGACSEPDGTAWLFVEDVGDVRYSQDDRAHRELAARWLGRMHGVTAAMAGRVPLPPAGQERYLGHLRSARATILENLGNEALSAEARAVLSAVLGQFDRLESAWPRLERACAAFPVTLLHADFQPKNLRIRDSGGDPELHPIDWETAGWGVPAADLARLLRRGPVSHVAAPVYAETIREHLPQLDLAAIERLSVIGVVFQSLAGVDWSCAELHFDSAAWLIEPINTMRLYHARIHDALDSSGEWR